MIETLRTTGSVGEHKVVKIIPGMRKLKVLGARDTKSGRGTKIERIRVGILSQFGEYGTSYTTEQWMHQFPDGIVCNTPYHAATEFSVGVEFLSDCEFEIDLEIA